MNPKTRTALEAGGFSVEDNPNDFLGLTAEDRQYVEFRLQLARTTRRLRDEKDLTQKDLAKRLKTSQPRVAKIETPATDVSLDQLVNAVFAAGGGLADISQAADTAAAALRPRSAGEGGPGGQVSRPTAPRGSALGNAPTPFSQ